MRELIADEHPEAKVSLSHEVVPALARVRPHEHDPGRRVPEAARRRATSTNLARAACAGPACGANFLVMKSNGGLVDHRAAAAKPVDLLVSGPVGGVLSAVYFGRLDRPREPRSRMDMGGTSFDVSLIAGGEAQPHDRVRDRVGPAGLHADGRRAHDRRRRRLDRLDRQGRPAARRPASAGRATRARLLRPRRDGADGHRRQRRARPHQPRLLPRRRDAARRRPPRARRSARLGERARAWRSRTSARAIVELVDFNMVNAIRLVSIDRGLDPRDFTLVVVRRRRLAARRRPGRDHRHPTTCSSRSTRACSRRFGLMTADMRVDESLTASMRSDLLDVERRRPRLSTACARARCDASRPRATTATPTARGHGRDALPRPELLHRHPARRSTTGRVGAGRSGRDARRASTPSTGASTATTSPTRSWSSSRSRSAAIGVTEKPRAAAARAAAGAGRATGRPRRLLQRTAAGCRRPIYDRATPAGRAAAFEGPGGRRGAHVHDAGPPGPAARGRRLRQPHPSTARSRRRREHRARRSDRRPGHAAGRQQLPRHDGARDGHRDAQHVVLAALQRGPRLLVRDLRRRAAR